MSMRYSGVFTGLLVLLFNAGIFGGSVPSTDLIRIDSATFDTVTHRFRVAWSLDTTEVPAGCEGAFVAQAGASAPIPLSSTAHPFPITTLAGDTVFEWEPLLFDTTYRVGIQLRLQGTWTIPDTSVLKRVSVPSANWEPVTLFASGVRDTLFLLNNRLLLWRDGSYGSGTPLHADTVRRYQPSAKRLKGFRAPGICFRFVAPVPLPSFYIGFRLDSLANKRMQYRIFRDSGGLFLNEHATVADTARRLLYFKTTDQIDLPFLVLADTLPPRVAMTSDTGRLLDAKPLNLTFTIRDNSANCRWKLFSGNAGDAPFAREAAFSGILRDTAGNVTCQLSTIGALDAGLRVYLAIDDGTRADTINISYTVARSRCNEMTTTADMVMPIAPTAKLDSTSCRYALRTLFKNGGNRYASSVFRVYKWAPSQSGSSKAGWMEYSNATAKQFTFLPGNLFWLITRSETAIDFGNGRSPSFKDTLKIDLPPGEWTDFSSPFSFPVAVSEVLASTGTTAEHLHFHQWAKDAAHRTWRAAPLFSSEVPGLDDKDIPLAHGTNGFFTIFNPSDSSVRLRIPPVAPGANTASPKKAVLQTPDGDWSIRFDLVQGNSISGSALCAVSSTRNTPLTIPPPPSFSGPSISIRRPGTSSASGILVFPATRPDLCTFELTVSNPAASPADLSCIPSVITGRAEGTMAIGSSVQSLSTPVTLSLGAHESRTIICSVGASSGNNHYSLPGAAATRIISLSRHSPGGSDLLVRFVAPAFRHRLDLFDVNGHRYTALPSRPGINAGEYCAVIRSRGIPNGCYLIRLKTFNDDGSAELHIQKKILLPR